MNRSFLSLFLLPIYMSFLLSTAKGSPATVVNCSRSSTSSCGLQTLNISFPFSGPDQEEYCGLPEYRLSCSGGEPTILFGSRRYRVKRIDYALRVVTVGEMDSVLRDACHWPQLGNTTLDPALFDLAFSTEKLVLFRCTTPPSAPTLRSLTRLDCSSYTYRKGVLWYYYKKGEEGQVWDDWPASCDPPVVIPLRRMAVEELSSTPTVEKFMAALSQGFDVQWKAQFEWCINCSHSNETCHHNLLKCFCSKSTHLWFCSSKSEDSGRNVRTKLFIACGASLAGFLLFIIVLLLCIRRNSFYILRKGHKRTPASVEDFIVAQGPLALNRYSYRQVKRMTNSFRTELGHGGYGSVFKGNLTNSNGVLIPVAVKLLGDSKGSGDAGEDFINEVASIGRTNHIHIVSLLGFCSQGSKRALIYEFMPNGSLEKYLFSRNHNTATPLAWDQLYNIALGIAKGLEYLHKGCRTRIVHFDIKPHNILLDKDFCPKISDFGLAKFCRANESILSMECARGTIGYIAPEVFSKNFGVVSSKSDVYSYGMMVLEMVGGRRNFDGGVDKSSEMYFPHWIYEHLDQHADLVDGEIAPENVEFVKKMAMVGLWCIQTNPSCRPSISRVVEMLEGSVEDLEMPPKPYMCSPERSMPNISSSNSSSMSTGLIQKN